MIDAEILSVSIVMPAHNSQRFIASAIMSVISQSYLSWELLVINDASTDNTSSIIQDYCKQDQRIRLINVTVNSGAAVARNIGLSQAKGRYIAFIDSDDLWHPKKLELQLQFMIQNNIAFSYTNYRLMSESGDVFGKLIRLPKRLDYYGLLKNTGIAGCLTVVIDRHKTGAFQMREIPHGEDLILWLQLIKSGFVAHGLDADLASYRISKNSASSNKYRSARRVWRIYRDIEKLNLFDTCLCFFHYAKSAYIKSRSLPRLR
jgi:teichuronic acid biosynthesis glycosyltransferase TuaG